MVPSSPDGKDFVGGDTETGARGPGGLLVKVASGVVSVSSGARTTPAGSPSAAIRLTLALVSECKT